MSHFIDAEIADLEWKTMFQNYPQLVGGSGDLIGSGSFFTVNDFGVPIIFTRGDGGEVRVFVNACRHRGAVLEHRQRGRQSRFSCPYHAWTYANNGALVGVPKNDHFGDIDKSCHGLIELPACERAGLIWVHPQPDGVIDIEDLLGGLLPELEWHGWDKFEFTGESLFRADLNWKLANDTFGESYHIATLHSNTVALKVVPHTTSHEVFGRNHRWVFAERSIELMRDLPEAEWDILKSAYIDYFIFPNIQLLVSAGNVNIFKIYPDPADPSKSISRSWQYFDPEIIEAYRTGRPLADGRIIAGPNAYDVDYSKGVQLSPDAMLDIMANTVRDEDFWAGASIQEVANSGRLSHVLYGRNEAPAQHFHRSFCDAIGMSEAFERIS